MLGSYNHAPTWHGMIVLARFGYHVSAFSADFTRSWNSCISTRLADPAGHTHTFQDPKGQGLSLSEALDIADEWLFKR